MMPVKTTGGSGGDIKRLSVNNIPPFVKGGWGDFSKAGQSKSPYDPLLQGGIY